MSLLPDTLTVDPEALLQPISEDQPEGESLRYEGTWDRIQEARRQDDPHLPQGVWKTPRKQADWSAAAELCVEALSTRSKDLRIAAWLTEAWTTLFGVQGTTQGLRVVQGLCERFWARLYPALEDDAEARVAPIAWLDDHIDVILRTRPITTARADGKPGFTLSDWNEALKLTALSPKDRKALRVGTPEGPPTRADILALASRTSPEELATLRASTDQALETLQALEGLFRERLGSEARGLGRLRRALQELREFVRLVGGDAEPAAQGEPEAEAEETPAAPAAATPSAGPIRSRAEAYRRLAEAADFLLRTEPHSPTPYLVRRAIAWGDMSLVELLDELVQHKDTMKDIRELLGVRD